MERPVKDVKAQNDAFEKCSNSNTSSPKSLKNHSNSQRHLSRDAKRAGKAAKPQSLKADSFTLDNLSKGLNFAQVVANATTSRALSAGQKRETSGRNLLR